MVKDQFLVVLGILEGRKFPKRSRHQIVVEAKFDGELLSTDPVDHTETPDLNTELAWELNKKSLHQHRLQRTPIKLQCYAVDTLTSAKEAVGYVIIDIRQAKQDDPTPSPRWYSLLSSKYSRYKPEIRASISIETDSVDKKDSSFRAKDAPPRDDIDPRTLKAQLNEEEGYYQIGPADRCTQHFVLSVTVAFASNLPQLVPMSMPLPSRGSGFFFYYSLLGNDVTNESFHNLLNPDFPAERASVRVRSSVQVLRLFLAAQPGLQIHLCCGDHSLGSTEVPLNTLLKSASDQMDKPASVEGSFVLNPPNRVKQQLPPTGGDMVPSVGVSITLRQDTGSGPPSQPTDSTSPAKEHPITPSQPRETRVSDKRPQTPPPEERPPPPPQGHTPPQRLPPSPPVSPSSDTQGTEQGLSSLGEDGSKREAREQGETRTAGEHGKPTEDPKLPEPTHPLSTQAKPPVADSRPSSVTTSQPYVSIPPAAHHFCFSLDLRSIQDVETSTSAPLYIFLRYTYPFFGSAAPILTHPPVEIRRNMEVLLPQSFCAFDFASTPQQLQDTFTRIPIMVEVWHKDKISQDALVGVARISLNSIITAEKARFVNAQGVSGWRQSHSTRIPVLSVDGNLRKVGEVYVVMTLEDLGQVTTQQILIGSDTSQSASVPVAPPPAPVPAPAPSPPPADPRETVEYQMAMELEMWKEQQENMFESQLKQKELQTMQALAEEWKRRDRERELLVQKKLTEYQQLEEKLRTTLADLERREKQLTSGEAEVVRMKADLQRDHDRTLTELREASRRLKEDCDHEVQLERAKVRELELHNQRLREQLQEAERRVQQKEKDFDEYRGQQAGKPEYKLQSEINLMTLEKVELERKLDYVAKSKLHYKQQWGRALKELARLKQREQTNAKARLKQQQQELEHMRLRYLAAEEKEIVKAEKQELETIKEELTRLKDQRLPEQPAAPDTRRASDGHLEHMQPLVPEDDTSMIDDHVTRLIEERDTLLRTGVYTHEDRIITELDRQIREAIARKGGR
ncbi:PREDICTED: centrosomal protein of 120 kDa-like isoform X2 [Branchiostoma belcheri]|uniref:Centrosomal protein of 120 kDa-like isoform X2 n=1 Tax=Branchiostoma belcheri TaxID=7741 RepID=A0A6P4Y8Y7_BRABE|nr:PREDICTED: centrosomal protein of 120 kDa-like isoform X2 [Branchiostoma belcheri]